MAPRAPSSMEFTFVCELHAGLHARPSSSLAEVAKRFTSETILKNFRNGLTANLKSVLEIIATDVRRDDTCSIEVTGPGEEAAYAALRRFIGRDLLLCDEPETGAVRDVQAGRLPRPLQGIGIGCLMGQSVSGGVGQGKVVMAGGIMLPRELGAEQGEDSGQEHELVERAVLGVRARIEDLLAGKRSPAEAGVLKAHLAMVSDLALANKLAECVAQGRSAGRAVVETCEYFITLLRQSESFYIRERALDVQEICIQLLAEMYGTKFKPQVITLNESSIVVAETLAPQQFLGFDRQWLKGLVLQSAGVTSHTVILARALGIPTLVGVKDAPRLLFSGQEVVVDADRGLLVPEWTPPVKRFYEREWDTLRRRQTVLSRFAELPVTTMDGQKLEVAANISSLEEAASAFEKGADGIGLFRTEMLFLEREDSPSEEEQFTIYVRAAQMAKGRRVIIRSLDIGGDKPLPHLELPKEDNPFLGYRGIRIYPEHQKMLRDQLRAILRASAYGPIQLMAPMISCLEEVLWFKAQISQVQRELREGGVAFDSAMPVGIMIEVPAAAFVLDEISREVDFFSVGTNDLSQYLLAADRNNARVAGLSSVRHPGFIRFLRQIVDGARRGKKWIGMCGEMAGDIRHLPLLLAMGFDEISVSPSEILAMKECLSRLSALDCEQLLQRVLDCKQLEEVNRLLDHGQSVQEARLLLDPELVLFDSASESKEEAMRELVDLFYISGWTKARQALEDALWAREAVYSTGLGFGFAIPHCKTDAVTASSIGILKFKQPVHWGSLDGEPVRMVIMLAMRESDKNRGHMRIFSALARRLMDEQFRNRLLFAEDSATLIAYLGKELDLAGQ